MSETQNTPASRRFDGAAGSADDHSGVRRTDVVRYLRAEACRDVPDQWWGADLQRLMRVLADYFDRTQSPNSGMNDAQSQYPVGSAEHKA